MLFYYIAGIERSSDVQNNSLSINNQIQQRSDNCSFVVFKNTKPVENQDIKIYDGDYISSIAGSVITLQGKFQSNVRKFYPGQVLWVRIDNSNSEKVVVQSYSESLLQITLVAAPVITVSNGDKIGELIFGGIVTRVQDKNLHSLTNLEYNVTGVDYAKIFDKKIVADTWQDVDGRYILNDAVNTTVNYNSTINTLSYTANAVIQAAWTRSGDAALATVDTSDYLEDTSSGVFGWTFSAGFAMWASSFSPKDLSGLVGATTGMPTKGFGMLWAKVSDLTKVTNIKVRIGSTSTNYAVYTMVPTESGDWGYLNAKLASASVVGVPNWVSSAYVAIYITETASSSMRLNGIRINDQSSFSLFNTQSTALISDYRAPQIKPTELVNSIAKAFELVWYIDYEKDIHLTTKETLPSPYDITDITNNFDDLRIEADVTNLGNRIIINGGEFTSSSIYAQVIPADGTERAWLLKSKFNNLVVKIDDNTTTGLTAAGTTTTNAHVIAHGLSVNDHVTNRTRNNTVRQVLTVPDADHYTVEAIPSQTSGDTISYFSKTPTLGIEGIDNEANFGYVYNSNEKSVRSSSQTATLTSGTFLRFAYNERVPLQFQYSDTTSVNALKALGFGDGIFDLSPIRDANITDINTAVLLAQAKVGEFSNAIINGSFTTDQRGLKSGQLLNINQTIGRTFSGTYVIQKVNIKQQEGEFKDYARFVITFGTTLFGWIEFMQKLLRSGKSVGFNEDEIVSAFVNSSETMEAGDVNSLAIDGGFISKKNTEVPTVSETNTVVMVVAGTWKWEASVGQQLATRWDLFSWG